jgi:hypothetical protein
MKGAWTACLLAVLLPEVPTSAPNHLCNQFLARVMLKQILSKARALASGHEDKE